MKYSFMYEILLSIIRIIPVNMTHQKLLRLVVWYVLKLFAVVHQTYLCIEKKIMNERAKKSLKGKLWTLLNPPTFSTPQFIFSLNQVFQSSLILYSRMKIFKNKIFGILLRLKRNGHYGYIVRSFIDIKIDLWLTQIGWLGTPNNLCNAYLCSP